MRSVFLAFCRGVCYNIGNIPGDRKNRGVITDEKYKIAALLMIIHGGFMEIGGVLCMIPALLLGTDKFDIGQYFSFKLSYFQENLSLMIVMGAMYGVLRLIGAIGLLKNRIWLAEKQNVGTGAVCYHLCYYTVVDDVPAACRNHGRHTCRQCFDLAADTVFRR